MSYDDATVATAGGEDIVTTIVAGGDTSDIAVSTVADILNVVSYATSITTTSDISTVVVETTLPGGGGGSRYMPPADLIDDADPAYFYFGWTSYSGSWQINQQTRATSAITRATLLNNMTPDLATAWPLRAGLTYS